MARAADKMAVFDHVFEAWQPSDPWLHKEGGTPSYDPDFALLETLLGIAVAQGGADESESGVFPKGIDLWLSSELRRAGFLDDECWPRLSQPRILPREVALLIEKMPTRVRGYRGLNLREEVQRRVLDLASITPADASILGRAYDKQVDVCIARWDRGPEVMVSTKAQLSSFAKNLPNRFEEAYGDAANLRARYPLAATGYFFLQRSTILTREPDTFERTKDMMRKLRAVGDGPGYTATGLALVDWDEGDPDTLHMRLDAVPEDLHPAQFLEEMVAQVLRVTPVTHHVQARERLERRRLPVTDSDDDELDGLVEPVSESAEPGEGEVESVRVKPQKQAPPETGQGTKGAS